MFILSGEFGCRDFDPEVEEIKEEVICDPGTAVRVPSRAPRGMKSIGDQACTFLCCIGNVYEE